MPAPSKRSRSSGASSRGPLSDPSGVVLPWSRSPRRLPDAVVKEPWLRVVTRCRCWWSSEGTGESHFRSDPAGSPPYRRGGWPALLGTALSEPFVIDVQVIEVRIDQLNQVEHLKPFHRLAGLVCRAAPMTTGPARSTTVSRATGHCGSDRTAGARARVRAWVRRGRGSPRGRATRAGQRGRDGQAHARARRGPQGCGGGGMWPRLRGGGGGVMGKISNRPQNPILNVLRP